MSTFLRRPLVRALAIWALAAPIAGAQVVKITAGRILPFEGVGVVPKSANDPNPPKGASDIALYGTAFLGSPGVIGDLPPGEKVAFRYVSLHLLFSAAALPRAGGADIKTSGNLRRL